MGGELRASVTIKNTGKRRGTEVVQLYAADTATGVTLPAQQLVGFARIELDPGASKTIAFELQVSVLAYTALSYELVAKTRVRRGECRQQFGRYPIEGHVHHYREDTRHPW